MRRHIFAVTLILVVTAGIAIDFKYAPNTYTETATVAVEPESFQSIEPLSIDSSYLQNTSLIATCQLLVMHFSGLQGKAQLRQAGISADFTVSLVNDGNADEPVYDHPELLVSATDENPHGAHQQLGDGMQVIAADVAGFEAGHKFSNQNRINTYVLSDSGPISQRGSLVRSYAALSFISLVATFLACRFLDRRSRRDRRISRHLRKRYDARSALAVLVVRT